MPRRSHDRDPDETRQAILDAALSLFSEGGFHATPVPEIGRLAKVGPGTIYRHFESKEGLVNALYRATKLALMTHLMSDFPWQGEPRVQFRALFSRLFDFAQREARTFRFLEHHHHESYLDEESLRVEACALEPLLGYVERAHAQGALKPLPAEALVAIVWGMVSGLSKARGLGQIQVDRALLETCERAAWDAVAATTP